MDNPLISIIVPVYNPGKHLRKCLESLIHQTYPHLQIILVDDGSTDGSGGLCDEYAAKDKRIICIHQPNSGVSKARNRGMEAAYGDYYHFPDSDDYLDPDTYEYLMDLVEKHGCDIVNFEYYVTEPDREIVHCLKDDQYGLFSPEEAHRIVLTGEPFAWNKLYSRNIVKGKTVLDRIRFREDIHRGEDSLFAHQAVDRAEKIWFDKRPLYHYVQSGESAVRGKFRRSQLSVMKLYKAYRPLYPDKYPALYPVFLTTMSHLLISLYYDMWSDADRFGRDQNRVYRCFKKYYPRTIRGNLSKKERIKFAMFQASPELFCRSHKILHRF